MVGKAAMDLVGQTFGRLFIFEKATSRRDGRGRDRGARWKYRCLCGKEGIVRGCDLRTGRTKSCGCLIHAKGSESRGWKGGNAILDKSSGYMVRFRDGKTVLDHRWVMEQYLGHPLLIGQNVHHKNGDRADNRIENLEIWDTSQPAGQRSEDKVKFAIEMLKRYAPSALAEQD